MHILVFLQELGLAAKLKTKNSHQLNNEVLLALLPSPLRFHCLLLWPSVTRVGLQLAH